MSILTIAAATFILSLIALVWAAHLFVNGSAVTAKYLGMTPAMIGLTIVAFGTSAPEIIVSIDAAINGAADLGVGNAIGSNIANIGLVLGVTAIISTIPIAKNILRLETPLLLTATALAVFCLWDHQLDRAEGWLLLCCALIFPFILYQSHKNSSHTPGSEAEDEIPNLSPLKSTVFLITGLIVLLISANLLVSSATTLAESFGVSPMIIGLTVVALGTSLPELAASITSALKGHHEMALGNIIGSNILNILAVMSLPGIIAPVSLNESVMTRDVAIMSGLTLFLVGLMWFKLRKQPAASLTTNQPAQTAGIGRLAGILFVSSYIAYYVIVFATSTTS